MKYGELIRNTGINDLPRDYRQIAEIVGFEKYLDLLERQGGAYIYLPTVRTALKASFNRQIFSEYDGSNKFVLMKKYDLSEGTVKRIIQEGLLNRSGEHERRKSTPGNIGT